MEDQPHLGIDIGGVIIPMVNRSGRGDTQFFEKVLTTPSQPGAFEKIAELFIAFAGNVSIVSKAGTRIEALTRQWLHERDFHSLVGLDENRLHFCRTRQEKEPICKAEGITHFVDDRVHVMQILRKTVPHLYLFGDKDVNRGAKRWTTLVENWEEATAAILNDLKSNASSDAG